MRILSLTKRAWIFLWRLFVKLSKYEVLRSHIANVEGGNVL